MRTVDPDLAGGDFGYEFVAILDVLAIDADDDVARLETGLVGWLTRLDAR